MIGLDTSILVALSLIEHPFHERARALLLKEGEEAEEFLALTPAVVAESIHAVTDPRRFEKPLSMAEALADARRWWTARQVRRVFPTQASVVLGLDWMEKFQLGRKRILDTQLAATLHTAGVNRLFTSNPDDFRVFGVFELLVP